MGEMNVLVTGNEGYIGSVVTAELVRRGYHVTGFDNGLFREVAFVPRATPVQHQVYKDIRDATGEDLEGMDAIIHLAGLSNDPLGEFNPALTNSINHHATLRLAEIAKEAGVKRFLFSSSCSLYGASAQTLVDETAPFLPQTAYAQSKIDAEEGLRKLADNNFSPIFLRNATVFGISPRLRLDLVVQNLLALAYVTHVIKLISDGTPWRPLVHIQDVADAFCFLLEQPRERIHNQAFNISHPANNVQIKDVAETIASTVPRSTIALSAQANPDTRSYKVSVKKVAALGWQARWDLPRGVREIYSIFQQRGFTAADLASDHYITLKRWRTAQTRGVLNHELRLA
jgi:nucleoside-diphosphate-sugar epimerase